MEKWESNNIPRRQLEILKMKKLAYTIVTSLLVVFCNTSLVKAEPSNPLFIPDQNLIESLKPSLIDRSDSNNLQFTHSGEQGENKDNVGEIIEQLTLPKNAPQFLQNLQNLGFLPYLDKHLVPPGRYEEGLGKYDQLFQISTKY